MPSKINDDQIKNSTGISVDSILPVGRLKDRVHVWDQLQVDRYMRDVLSTDKTTQGINRDKAV